MPIASRSGVMLSIEASSHTNYLNALEGQWFIGVVDTQSQMIHLLPISPASPDALTNTGSRNRNRYTSGAITQPVWVGCTADWMDRVPGHTTHQRCTTFFQLREEDCLGFTLISRA